MSDLLTVFKAYKAAWSRRRVFVVTYLALRLITYAMLAPLLGGLINFAVSLSDQAALTDQDIAGFLLTPAGFVAATVVLGLLLVVEVLGFAVMAAIWRGGGADSLIAARSAFWSVLRRARPLVMFAILFVLRVLALSLPFVVAGLLIAWWLLGEYDINYYLTYRPPEALLAGVLIAALLLALAALLLVRLSGWALALHTVLFDATAPRAAFARSATRMTGHRLRLQRQMIGWLVLRAVLMGVMGLLAGGVLHLMPLETAESLRRVLAVTLAMVLLWELGNTVISALALGALARLVHDYFDGGASLPAAPERAPGSFRRALALAGVAIAGLAVVGFGSAGQLLDRISTEDQVEIIAHRGAAGSRPENTLAAVEQAIGDGADWVEIDVQETADGQVVVMHDSDFMKLAGVDLKIWDAEMDDLAGIDIGGWFDPVYADQRTPLLRDVLATAKDRSKVLIELKYYGHDVALETRVAEIVKDLQMADQIATMSLKYPAVQKMRALQPDWRTGVLAATAIGDLTGLEGDFIAVNMGQAGPRLVETTDAAGKDLYVWTVNDPLDMSKMISMGVDGLITDEPALARQVLQIRAELSTPERLILWLSEELGLSLSNARGYRDDSP